jgi:hypothetical protein
VQSLGARVLPCLLPVVSASPLPMASKKVCGDGLGRSNSPLLMGMLSGGRMCRPACQLVVDPAGVQREDSPC